MFNGLMVLVGIIVTGSITLIGIGVNIFLNIRNNPKKELRYTADAISLLRSPNRSGRLRVTYEDQNLEDPFVATVRFRCTGRANIAKSDFEGDPVRVHFGVPVIAPLSGVADPTRTRVRIKREETSIALFPVMLPKGFDIQISFLCDGRPDFDFQSNLANITVTKEAGFTELLEAANSQASNRGLSSSIISAVAGIATAALVLIQLFSG